jgi:hypothetical protein
VKLRAQLRLRPQQWLRHQPGTLGRRGCWQACGARLLLLLLVVVMLVDLLLLLLWWWQLVPQRQHVRRVQKHKGCDAGQLALQRTQPALC